MPIVNVSEEAIQAEKNFYTRLDKAQAAIEKDFQSLKKEYESNLGGLGAHSKQLGALIESLGQKGTSQRVVTKLKNVLELSITNRMKHRDDWVLKSVKNNLSENNTDDYIAGVMGRLYEGGYRKMRTQNVDGNWNGNVFVPDRVALPKKYNPRNKTFGEIIDNIYEKYGLKYTGTPYKDGHADFAEISLAQVSLADVVEKHIQAEAKTETFMLEDIDYSEILSQRKLNFRYADMVAAEQKIPIPGLPDEYSWKDLEKWRSDNLFTWDESYLNGYLLVPAEIHNNISHTGLVAINLHEDRIEKRALRKNKNKE